MNIKHTLIRNVSVRWIGYALSAAISFFMFPFMVNKLGDTVYGLWGLVCSLTGYLGILDFGIGFSMVKFISELEAKQQNQKIEQIINTTLFLSIAIGAIALCISGILAFIAPYFLKVETFFICTFRTLILIVGLQISIDFSCGIFGGILKGYHRYDIDTYIASATLLIRTLGIILVLLLGYGIIWIALICLLVNICGHLARYIFFRILYKEIRLHIQHFKKSFIKYIFTYSGSIWLIGITMQLVFYTDSIVISMFLPLASITYYMIGWRLLAGLREFVGLMTNTFVPMASEFDAMSDIAKNQKLLIEGSKYTAIIILFFITIFITFGKPIIGIWIGKQYIQESYPVLVILALSELIGISQFSAGSILLGMAKQHTLAIIGIIQAIANLLLSLILVQHYGMIGVALGTAIPYVIASLFFFPWYTGKHLHISPLYYFKKAFFSPLIGATPFIFICIFFATWRIDTLFQLFNILSICTFFFCIGIYFTCLKKETKYIKILFHKSQ